ncbi:MAG: sigma-70 family RNA polymerase sigma factor [Planctomycetota bacterium]
MAIEREAAENDRALLERARAGDSVACAILHGRYRRLVHGLALSLVPSSDVDDLSQDVFLRAFSRLDQLRDSNAFGPWLTTMTRNLARDQHRRRQRHPSLASIESESASTEDRDSELRERVFACIRSLPEAYREPLTLRLVEGLDGPEIARMTGKTHGSLRVNLHRGMQRLRTMLEGEGWP